MPPTSDAPDTSVTANTANTANTASTASTAATAGTSDTSDSASAYDLTAVAPVLFKAACPECRARFELPGDAILLAVGASRRTTSYSFTCPSCDSSIRKPAGERIVELLSQGGVRTLRLHSVAGGAPATDASRGPGRPGGSPGRGGRGGRGGPAGPADARH